MHLRWLWLFDSKFDYILLPRPRLQLQEPFINESLAIRGSPSSSTTRPQPGPLCCYVLDMPSPSKCTTTRRPPSSTTADTYPSVVVCFLPPRTRWPEHLRTVYDYRRVDPTRLVYHYFPYRRKNETDMSENTEYHDNPEGIRIRQVPLRNVKHYFPQQI
ncbi:hypothetical protein VPH35_077831 [Triticum aestivum]